MGSLEAMQERKESKQRYYSVGEIIVAQGVSGYVKSVGSVHQYVPHLVKSIKHGFQDIGLKTLTDIHNHKRIFVELRSINAKLEGSVNMFSYTHLI